MTTSIVNGYVCTSSCDVAKAKKGQDPHPNLHAADAADGKRGQDGKPGSSSLDGPAVLFGGSLRDLSGSQAVAGIDAPEATGPASLWKQGFSVDISA